MLGNHKIIITQNSAFHQYTDLPCPPVANLVPSGWMSTENIGFPGIREQAATYWIVLHSRECGNARTTITLLPGKWLSPPKNSNCKNHSWLQELRAACWQKWQPIKSLYGSYHATKTSNNQGHLIQQDKPNSSKQSNITKQVSTRQNCIWVWNFFQVSTAH